jgi:hypothetical protein
VQGLLGHASRETTIRHYLAPVRHLQLESLLTAAPTPMDDPAVSMDDLFTQVARAANGIQDIETALTPTGERAPREDVPMLVRALSQLTAENEALRDQLQLSTPTVVPLRPGREA